MRRPLTCQEDGERAGDANMFSQWIHSLLKIDAQFGYGEAPLFISSGWSRESSHGFWRERHRLSSLSMMSKVLFSSSAFGPGGDGLEVIPSKFRYSGSFALRSSALTREARSHSEWLAIDFARCSEKWSASGSG